MMTVPDPKNIKKIGNISVNNVVGRVWHTLQTGSMFSSTKKVSMSSSLSFTVSKVGVGSDRLFFRAA